LSPRGQPMSDQLTAASNAMGIPEPLVERSAEARAAESGSSTEEILTAWAGGEAAPTAAPPETPDEAPEPETEEPAAEEPVEEEPATPEIVIDTPAEEAPETTERPVPAGPYKPPVLVGARDNPMTILAAVVGLFVVTFLVGFVGPSFQGEAPGARTSEIGYSGEALEGQAIYASLNCDSCHTQMVRPVIADVGLGAVTVHDSNQILGTRRFGPDLSNAGARISGSQLAAIVGGLGEHPAYSLSEDDLGALVAYLGESQTLEDEADAGEAGSETES
jgi:cytochrome c oxidase cbb3-type subunit 2